MTGSFCWCKEMILLAVLWLAVTCLWPLLRTAKENEMKCKRNKKIERKMEQIVFKQLSLKIIAVVIRKMICHLKNAAVKLLVHQKKALEKKDKFKANRIIRSRDSTGPSQCSLSDRKATMVIAAVTKHLGNELEEVTLSCSTKRRARKSNRQNYALQKRNDFVPTAPLLLHWDGKMFPGLTRVHADRENRVAVVVSWKNSDMLLGDPHIPSGTGKIMPMCVLSSYTSGI